MPGGGVKMGKRRMGKSFKWESVWVFGRNREQLIEERRARRGSLETEMGPDCGRPNAKAFHIMYTHRKL